MASYGQPAKWPGEALCASFADQNLSAELRSEVTELLPCAQSWPLGALGPAGVT